MYDYTGHVAVQIMRRPDRPKFKSGVPTQGTPEELKAAFEGYSAYHGTYEVNEREGFVIHHVEGSLFPNEVGKDKIRFYELLSNDRIALIATSIVGGKTEPKSPLARRLTWERVR